MLHKVCGKLHTPHTIRKSCYRMRIFFVQSLVEHFKHTQYCFHLKLLKKISLDPFYEKIVFCCSGNNFMKEKTKSFADFPQGIENI